MQKIGQSQSIDNSTIEIGMTIHSAVNIQLENKNQIQTRNTSNSASQRSEGESSDSTIEIEDTNEINEYQRLSNQANQTTETVHSHLMPSIQVSHSHVNLHSVDWVTKPTIFFIGCFIKYAFFRK